MEADMSLWGLFAQAGLFVKCIMIILLVVSLISWSIIFYRAQFLRQAQRLVIQFENQFWSGVDHGKLYEHLQAKPKLQQGLAAIFYAGYKEYYRLHKEDISVEVITDGCQRAMQVALSRETDKLETHMGFLATVGTMSPYVGLLGTVWGIMNSFIALGSVQQATLSMVAPGIAEALVATAMGLVAAIPAMVAYNRFTHQVVRLSTQYENFCKELTGILQRQVLKH